MIKPFGDIRSPKFRPGSGPLRGLDPYEGTKARTLKHQGLEDFRVWFDR